MGKKNIVTEHVGVVFAQLTGADGRSAVPQRWQEKKRTGRSCETADMLCSLHLVLFPSQCIVNIFA